MNTIRYSDFATVDDVLDDIYEDPDWDHWRVKDALKRLGFKMCILPEAVKFLAWEVAYGNEYADIDVRMEMMNGEAYYYGY